MSDRFLSGVGKPKSLCESLHSEKLSDSAHCIATGGGD